MTWTLEAPAAFKIKETSAGPLFSSSSAGAAAATPTGAAAVTPNSASTALTNSFNYTTVISFNAAMISSFVNFAMIIILLDWHYLSATALTAQAKERIGACKHDKNMEMRPSLPGNLEISIIPALS